MSVPPTDPVTDWGFTPAGGVPVGVAVRVQAGDCAVPPLLLVTVLARWRRAVWLKAVHRIRVPNGTDTAPLPPSAKPGITVPAASTSTHCQEPVDPGTRTA